MLRIKNLSYYFGNHKVIDNINLQINKGESVVILGGSGNGKSVLFKLISKLLYIQHGCIEVDGHTDYTPEEVTMLFQNNALFDSMPVWENVVFSKLYSKSNKINNISKEELIELAKNLLDSVGLDNSILHMFPSELSGGMKRRVAIARTILSIPKLILLDEPTTGLDPINTDIINKIIVNMSKKQGITCITVTHDMYSAMHISDKIAVIQNGKIIWFGDKLNIFDFQNDYVQNLLSCTHLQQIYNL